MIAGLFGAYPKASSIKMILSSLAGIFNPHSVLKIETYKASSVAEKVSSKVYQSKQKKRANILLPLVLKVTLNSISRTKL